MNLLQGLLLGVHILGATIWVGGSVVLGMATMVLSRDREGGADRIAEVGRRVGPLLWTALAATVATGLYNLTWYLPPGTGWTSWIGLPEGPILLAKLVLVSVMVAAAALHSFVLGPRLMSLRRRGSPPTRLRRLSRWNRFLALLSTVAGVVVIFLAALLGAW